MPLLYHAYVYLEFLILACTIYILAPRCRVWNLRSRIGCMGKWCEYNLEWKEAGQWEM